MEVILFTPRTIGRFDMPLEDEEEGISIQQLGEGHPLDTFDITLVPDSRAEVVQNVDWRFQVDGVQEFEIRIEGRVCHPAQPTDLTVSVYYYNGSGGYEGWETSISDPGTNTDIDIDCGNPKEVWIDLLGTTSLDYGEVDDDRGRDLDPEATFDHHEDEVTEEPIDYEVDDEEELGFLVNHYLQLLGPTLELTVTDDGRGNGVIDEGESFGYLEYEQGGGPRFITFLHITENRVTVELD
ncbi:MAG: hypothetical protein U5J98_08175 [Halobacteriales archaeon]|nr:hypothetical protein [Halobacteriales archaeon]